MKRLALLLAALALPLGADAQPVPPFAPGESAGLSAHMNSAFSQYLRLDAVPPVASLVLVSPGASADATAMLQAAFAASATTPVYLSCGTYNTTQPLTVPHNGIVKSDLIWSYDTPTSFPNSVPCALIKANNAGATFGAGTAVITLTDYTLLSGVAVKGTNIAGQADALKVTGRFVLARDNYLFQANNGVLCQAPAIGFQFIHNLVGINKNMGLLLGAGCPDNLITQNTFYSNAFIGIAAYATSKGIFTHNTLEWNGTVGMELFNDNDIVLSNNQFDRNSGVGLRINSVAGQNVGISVTSNTFRRNGAGAVAGADAHIILDGITDRLSMAGNAYTKFQINDDNTGIVAPNYLLMGTSTGMTNSTLFDSFTAQLVGTYENATVQGAVQAALGTPIRAVTGSIGGGALGAGACASGTVAVVGSTTGQAVQASPETYPGDGFSWSGYVSAAGTVTVNVCALVAATPGATAYNVRVLQ